MLPAFQKIISSMEEYLDSLELVKIQIAVGLPWWRSG